MAHLTDEALLTAHRRYGRVPKHLRTCQLCQKRQADLLRALHQLAPEPYAHPNVDAYSILAQAHFTPRPKVSRILAVVASAAVLAAIPVAPSHPTWPTPVAMTASSLPFSTSHVTLQWRPGDIMGRIHTTNLSPHLGRVLEVWMVKGHQHIPVTVLPLTRTPQTITFAVPYPARDARAVGITMEPAPNMPVPTSPRIFGYHFSS
ncbi:anti-sigma factor domain-containing protein [Sulfobacillus sp. hq2]|uniref:anti-sigma factor domain-containing protein n=1 Tax=Sulfobacillus TaxID=28033 RepID=UPI000CD2757B|nr:anti-sigma factor [Sulfobacillus sp. hq2]POB09569.1 hypothetical protein CO251_15260 [Sulfobacillus sp. hq2]